MELSSGVSGVFFLHGTSECQPFLSGSLVPANLPFPSLVCDQRSFQVELLKFTFSLSPCLPLGHPSGTGKGGVCGHLTSYQGIPDSDDQAVEGQVSNIH